MNIAQALQALLSRRVRPDQLQSDQLHPAPDARPGLPSGDSALSGASFMAQEPALPKELRLTSEDISGWAMGGSSLSD